MLAYHPSTATAELSAPRPVGHTDRPHPSKALTDLALLALRGAPDEAGLFFGEAAPEARVDAEDAEQVMTCPEVDGHPAYDVVALEQGATLEAWFVFEILGGDRPTGDDGVARLANVILLGTRSDRYLAASCLPWAPAYAPTQKEHLSLWDQLEHGAQLRPQDHRQLLNRLLKGGGDRQ
jgi:hypothetical protein